MQDKRSQAIQIVPPVVNAGVAAIKHIEVSLPWLTFYICV